MSDTEKKPPRGQALTRLLSLAKPHWRELLIGTVFLAVGSAMSLIYPQLIKRIMDQALGKGGVDKSAVDFAAVLMLGVFLVDGVATSVRSYTFTKAGERIVSDLRSRLYTHILAQEIAFFDNHRTGELTSRLASDTTVLQNAVSVNISMMLRGVASVVGGVSLLMYTSPRLTVLMLAVVPVASVGVAIFGRRIRALSREAQDALAQTSEVAEETFAGLRTVRAFAREGTEAARYAKATETAFGVTLRRVRFVSTFAGAATFIGGAAISVVLWYGGHLVIAGVLTVGDLTAFLLYTLFVAFSLGMLGGLWTDFMRAIGATERVFELLDRTPLIDNSAGEELQQVRGEVELQHVSFTYPARDDMPVLNDISFHLKPGEVVALVGPSGSGKSTISALLARFYDAAEGRVRLDGRDVRELKPDWLRQHIGSVAQEPILFSTSIAENIRYGRTDARMQEVQDAARAANAHNFITQFPQGYDTPVGERGVQLSGGQKQRVAIARAVLKNPRVLILDEATSALDAESEHLVKEALDRLMQNRTTLVIAHRLSTVKDAHRVLVLENGRMVQSGTHAGLMQDTQGLYHRLVERQFAGA